MITTNSIVVASSKQQHSKLEKEVVILNLKSESYFSLNEVGADIWSLLQEPISVEKMISSLIAKYAVDHNQCESDVLALLKELSAVYLIELSSENLATETVIALENTASVAKEVWVAPELASYGTMASLVHSAGGSVGDAAMVGLVNTNYGGGPFDGFPGAGNPNDTTSSAQQDSGTTTTGIDDPGSGDDYTEEYP